MSFQISGKANFTNPQTVPARDRWPAKTQIKVVTGDAEFFISSAVVDLTKIPLLEPMNFEGTAVRVSGGKGFNVIEVSAFSAVPAVAKSK